MFLKKKSTHATPCLVVHVVVAVLFLVAAIAALLGVYHSHVLKAGVLVFGTSSGSLALIAFAVTLAFFMKALKHCCGSCEACGMNGKK
jgi:hypothetical protein